MSTESVGGDCLEAMLSEPCADLPSVLPLAEGCPSVAKKLQQTFGLGSSDLAARLWNDGSNSGTVWLAPDGVGSNGAVVRSGVVVFTHGAGGEWHPDQATLHLLLPAITRRKIKVPLREAVDLLEELLLGPIDDPADGVLEDESLNQWEQLRGDGAVIMDFGSSEPTESRRCTAVLLKKVGEKMMLSDTMTTNYAKKLIASLQKRAKKE